MRPRFSLRWLFIATTLIALLCYWIILPTIVAERFVRAAATDNYERADNCFRNVEDKFLVKWNEKHWRFKARGKPEPRTSKQLLRGPRVVVLTVMYGDAGPIRTLQGTVLVTRSGLLSPQLMNGMSHGMVVARN
jgi:hypothetical protein